MASDDVLCRCVERWRDEGIPLVPPADELEVRLTWSSLGRRPSRDVIQLYATVGGFADWVFDEHFLWCLWPLDRIRSQNAEWPTPGIQFCDHSINVVTWELRFEDDEYSSVWLNDGTESTPSHRTAPDLESFLRIYLDDPWRLLET